MIRQLTIESVQNDMLNISLSLHVSALDVWKRRGNDQYASKN
jgi:hypothetical protein